MSLTGKHILVTGAPRSGTTFLGKVLSLPRSVGYVDEPFNYQSGIRGVDKQFISVAEGRPDADRYDPMIEKLLSGKARYKRPMDFSGGSRSLPRKVARKLFTSQASFEYRSHVYNPFVHRLLLKDPMACLMTEHLHRKFGLDVVILVRHPASTVASFKRLGWHFSPQDLRSDAPKAPKLGKGRQADDLKRIWQLAEVWLYIYQTLLAFADRNLGMIVVRHEDLSLDPAERFKALYGKLDLAYTPGIDRKVRALTSPANPADPPGNVAHHLHRDSSANLHRWKNILTEEEVVLVKRTTMPFAGKFYPDREWRVA